MIRKNRNYAVPLQNPWTQAISTTMTWKDILIWSKVNIHSDLTAFDLASWRRRARHAFDRGDSRTLGIMILGS